MTQPRDKEAELYTILADYSDDLGALKKHDGKLPAQAAVARIKALLTQAKAEAILEELESLVRIYTTADIANKTIIQDLKDRIDQLKSKGEAHEDN